MLLDPKNPFTSELRGGLVALLAALSLGCGGGGGDRLDEDFEIPRGEIFPASLKSYGLFEEPLSELMPAEGAHLYELNAQLFTDYAGKQRLVRMPEGETVTLRDGRPDYPEGTLLAKTFSFEADLRDPSEGRHIVETRLLVKRAGQWNVATYLWNAEQTDATLTLDGATANVSFIDLSGNRRETGHEVPSEVACVTCHQRQGVTAYIGPKLENLDRAVERGGRAVDQLQHLSTLGVWPERPSPSTALVDPSDASRPLEARARSYMAINCAHCHNPEAWERSANQDLDLRHDVPLEETGILEELRALRRQLTEGEMPFIGTTLLHDEGVQLLLAYFDTL